MANVRKRFSAEEKAKIVLEILKGELTQQQIIAKYGVYSTQLRNWKKQALEGILSGFSGKHERQTQEQSQLVDELYQQIGKLKMELDWLKKKSDLFR